MFEHHREGGARDMNTASTIGDATANDDVQRPTDADRDNLAAGSSTPRRVWQARQTRLFLKAVPPSGVASR